MKSKEITHANKIMFPKSGITKGDLANYYEKVAVYMLPYLKNRPLTMHRFPDGIMKNGFFQKNASDYFPGWIRTEQVKKKDGWVNHVICDSADTLRYLVNHGTIAFHVALGTLEKLEYPDKLIFDLDPAIDDFKTVVEGAKIIHNLLKNELGMTPFVMTTGSRGLHITVPLNRTKNFDEVHDFTKNIAKYLSNEHPKKFTMAMRKDQREGKLFIDYVRNSYGQTGVCPFSVRAFENAPVATPLAWKELEDTSLNAQTYTIHNIFKRLGQNRNPWEFFEKKSKGIQKAVKKLATLEVQQHEKAYF